MVLGNTSADENIIALNRLFEYSSNKRFQISDSNITSKNISKKAIEIKEKIKREYDIDIFSENTTSKIEKFEHILSDLFSTNVEKLLKRNINDEAEVILNSKNINSRELHKYKIIIPNAFKENVTKYLPVNCNMLRRLCSNPDFASCIFPVESYNDYILTSLVEIKKIKRVIFIHLNRYSSTDLKTLKVSSLFAFKYELTKHLFQNRGAFRRRHR